MTIYGSTILNLVRIVDKCIFCSQDVEVVARADGIKAWQAGQYIQDALPELTPADREFLISQVCDPCFNETFAEPEGEEAS